MASKQGSLAELRIENHNIKDHDCHKKYYYQLMKCFVRLPEGSNDDSHNPHNLEVLDLDGDGHGARRGLHNNVTVARELE